MPEQKGWAGLEPETPKPLSDLKQKRGGQAFSHLKWPGIGQNELAGGPKVLLTATFWPRTFPEWPEQLGPISGKNHPELKTATPMRAVSFPAF
jgi:hypothetical protein